MTSLFPRTAYAEDQAYAHAILYAHVSRAFAGTLALGSLLTAPTSLLISRYRHSTPLTLSTLFPRLLVHSGRGLALGSVLGLLATYGQMRGRQEIEWQDRSWRLLGNMGQLEMDWWVGGGAVAGTVAGLVALRRGRVPAGLNLGARSVLLGSAGLGATAGQFGYAGWRYGVKGGRFEEVKASAGELAVIESKN